MVNYVFKLSRSLSPSRGSDSHTHTLNHTHTHMHSLSLSLSLRVLSITSLKGSLMTKSFQRKEEKKSRLKSEKDFNQVLLLSFFLSPTTLRHETKKKLITAKKYPEAKYWFSFDTMVLFNNVVFSTIPFSHQPGFSLLLSSSSPFQYFSPILVTFLCTQSHTLSHTHTPMHMHTHTQFLSQLVIWF